MDQTKTISTQSPQEKNTSIPVASNVITSVEQVRDLVQSLIKTDFPELKGVHITVKSQSMNDYTSFQSRPHILGLLNPFKKHRYIIVVNPKIIGRMPADIAEAVLGHELVHTLFYTTQKWGIWRGIKSRLSASYKQVFERGTDLEAVRRGFGPGLIKYIQWFAPQLPQKLRDKKYKNYLRIEEIKAAMRASPNSEQTRNLYTEHQLFWGRPKRNCGLNIPINHQSWYTHILEPIPY